MFSIYEMLPQILELWGDNLMAKVQAKKVGRSEREMTMSLSLLRNLEAESEFVSLTCD